MNRFRTCACHRHNQPFDVLFGVAESTEHPVIIFYVMRYFAPAFQFIQFDTVGRQPRTVRFRFGKLFFQFTVIVDFSFFCINQQNLSRLQASFFFYVSRFEVHYTYFGGNYHQVVFSDQIAGRAQTVTVEHTTGKTSVTEEQGCRSVPWFHQDRMILIERFQVLADRVFLVERFRYEHCHGMWQA